LAARVELPLSQDIGGVKRFGTRHRAARGITEHSDAVALVVSEETGTISLFYNREMTSNLSEESVVMLLMTLLHVDTQKPAVSA
jgi:diadenylate cyclase